MKTLTSRLLIIFLLLGQLLKAQSYTVTTFAGNFSGGFLDGTTQVAKFNNPSGICMGSGGVFYVVDQSNSRIRKIDSLGNVTTIAGNSSPGHIDGQGQSAKFYFPSDICIDFLGNLFITDTYNQCVRKIDTSGYVTTIAGNGVGGYTDGIGLSAQFKSPTGICVDKVGNIYVADTWNNCIRKINTAGVVSTFAGSVASGFLDGPAATSKFNQPSGICIDSLGNLYIVDQNNCSIRKIDTNSIVTTISGGPYCGFMDGPASNALFYFPERICCNQYGNLFVSDAYNYKIREIDTNGNVKTIAGSGVNGFANGIASKSKFDGSKGICIDLSGNIYIADYSNNLIRKISTCTPSKSVIYPVSYGEYISPSGKLFTSSGRYIDTISNSHNCDSIIIINLMVHDEIADIPFAVNNYTICNSATIYPILDSSVVGTNYNLIDNFNDFIEGPISGTGDTLYFPPSTETFSRKIHVLAQRLYTDTALYSFGISSYAQTPTMSLSQDFTFEVWIKSPSISDTSAGIVATSTSSSGVGGYMQLFFNGAGKLRAEVNGGTDYVIDGNTFVEDSVWHFIALTNSKDSIKLYVDGVLDSEVEKSLPELFSISRKINITDKRVEGNDGKLIIDRLSIWDTTRSYAEILSDMNRYFYGDEMHLKAHFDFEDGKGSTSVSDLMGNFDAQIIGTSSTDWLEGVRKKDIFSYAMSDILNVTVYSINNSVTNNSPTLISNHGWADYQWIDCNNGDMPIQGATNQSYTPTVNGSYAVIVKQNGCTDTSACQIVGNAGIYESIVSKSLSISPNPTTGQFVISLGESYQNVDLVIKNILGQVVQHLTYSNSSKIGASIEGEAGIYFVEVSVAGNKVTFKLVKQ